jgi:hypothetical protein
MHFLLIWAQVAAKTTPIAHLGIAGDGIATKHDYRQTFKYPFFTEKPEIPYFNKYLCQ